MSIDSKPHLKSSFTFRDVIYDIDWFDLGDKLPDLPWAQVYAIGDVNGMVPVVHYDNGDPDNLPGGRLDLGETVDQALIREIQEEINHEIISWSPIGYQAHRKSNGDMVYQLRVHAKMRPIAEFTIDPGGHVCGHTLVPLDDLNLHINYGDVGDRMVKLVKGKRNV